MSIVENLVNNNQELEDCNEKLQVEKNLVGHEIKKNKWIIDNLQDTYIRTDKEGNIIMVNKGTLKMFGYENAEELIGKSVKILYENPDQRDEIMLLLVDEKGIIDFPVKRRRKDGSTFWASLNVQIISDVNGNLIGTEGVLRDTSERMALQESLEESESRFRFMLQSIPAAVLVVDLNSRQIDFVSSFLLKYWDILKMMFQILMFTLKKPTLIKNIEISYLLKHMMIRMMITIMGK